MDDRTSPTNSPWSVLATVTTFDRGNDAYSTRRLDNNNETNSNRQIVEHSNPSTSLLIESLIQQLCTMFEGDTVRRNKLYFAICDKLHELNLIDSTYNMMEFETLRGQYQRALYHLVAVARASTGSESALQVPSCLMAEWSRYRREFQEISFIAAGGFGQVFKALHRLDGIEYAIKKIVVRSGRIKTIMQHLEEVKTLAKLNHTNIVSYKGAWIEPTLPSTFVPTLPSTSRRDVPQGRQQQTRKSRSQRSYVIQDLDAQSDSNSDSSPRNRSSSNSDRQNVSYSLNKNVSYKTGMYVNTQLRQQKSVFGSAGGYVVSHDIINERFHELNSSTNIIGKRIVERNESFKLTEETNSDVVSFRAESKNTEARCDRTESNTNYTDSSDSREEPASSNQICRYNSRLNQQYATLYIQMALCDQTLQQWLNERSGTTTHTIVTAILTQIVCGLDYIHSRGIVHHDIKPSNIFISTSGRLQIQLGDFGLACPLQRDSHHSILGTHLYAAPEQLEGKCNPKSDIYSVGIVLLELLVPTQTQMERSRIIGDLKRGQIPTDITANYPKWAHMISQLVQKNPTHRPTTTQLLKDLSEDKDLTIAQLKHDISQKDITIQELQERILMLEAQISESNILENT